jgi:hypothetical protein
LEEEKRQIKEEIKDERRKELKYQTAKERENM